MLRLKLNAMSGVADAQELLQKAIAVEFGTIPPYLYAMFSIPQGQNVASAKLVKSVLLQEMVHMCLACNILNAIGGSPALTPPAYPGTLGDIGPDGKVLKVHLIAFSKDAMAQGMAIEQPETVPDFPVVALTATRESKAVTIGQFYAALDALLAKLPASAWTAGRNQITDDQFFAGQIFAVNCYADAHRAIDEIVSEGEGAKNDPLDFQHELAHYYRFGEVFNERVLTRTGGTPSYTFGPQKLDVDWKAVYPAIRDPGQHDFRNDPPAAQAAQHACNAAYSAMVDALQAAMNGGDGQLGVAVRAMFDLRMAVQVALHAPLADPATVAGPAFLYVSPVTGAAA